MENYKISEEADEDLRHLFRYGILTFGLNAASLYYDGLIERFEKLAENPYLFRAVEDIREGYRRSVYRSHSIYYRVGGEYVEVMRILSKQDTKTLLQEQ